jgi:hypothetical protein
MCVQTSGGSAYDQFSQFRPYTPLPLVVQDPSWQCTFKNNEWIYSPAAYTNNFFSNYQYVLPPTFRALPAVVNVQGWKSSPHFSPPKVPETEYQSFHDHPSVVILMCVRQQCIKMLDHLPSNKA